jgi:hypothetical protein
VDESDVRLNIVRTPTWQSNSQSREYIYLLIILAGPHVQTQKVQALLPISLIILRSTTSLTTNSSSRYFDTAIWSPSPFRRRVFSTRSRASACPEAGSSGRSLILESVGSPGVRVPSSINIRAIQRTHLALWTSDRTPAGRMPVLELPSVDPSQTHSRLSQESTLSPYRAVIPLSGRLV